mgnify:CR=1 FL=1
MFEYRVWSLMPHKLTDQQFEEALDAQGHEGWELVSLSDSIRKAGEVRAIFKRRKAVASVSTGS